MQAIGSTAQEAEVLGVDHWRHGLIVAGNTSGNLGAPPTGEAELFVARVGNQDSPRWVGQWPLPGPGYPTAMTTRCLGGMRVATWNQAGIGQVRRIDGKGRAVWTLAFPAGERPFGLAESWTGRLSVFVVTAAPGSRVLRYTVDRQGKIVANVAVQVELPSGGSAVLHAEGRNGRHLFGHNSIGPGGVAVAAATLVDAQGRAVWTWRADPGPRVFVRDVAVDRQGRSYVLLSAELSDDSGRLVVLAPDGRVLGMPAIEGPDGNIGPWEVTPASGGGAYVSVTVGEPRSLTVFVIDASWKVASRTALEPQSPVFIRSSWIDNAGRLVLAGSFYGTLFGRASKGEMDAFLVRLRPPGR